MKVVTEFKTHVSLRLPQSKSEVLRIFNQHHVGRETVPLDEEWPPSKYGYSMPRLHHRLHMTHRVEIVVQVLENGTLRLKPNK